MKSPLFVVQRTAAFYRVCAANLCPLFASLLTVLPSSLLACSYNELPLKSSQNTFANGDLCQTRDLEQ
ncbi:hypothetical protein Tco_0159640, partial [Tanacetum coccineum]